MMGYTDARATPSAARYAQLIALGRRPARRRRPAVSVLPRPPLDAPASEFDGAARRRPPTGWSNGSTTASARRWSSAPARSGSGRAAKSWSPSAFPRSSRSRDALPDGTVLDGEIVVWKDGRVAPFALLQQRIGRKTLTQEGARRRAGRLHRLRPARVAAASTCASGRSTSGARGSKRAGCERAATRRCGLSPLERARRLGRARRAARASRARAASKASCSSTATRATAPAAASRTISPTAPGGSGRSTRSASTACSSTRRPATAGAPASTPTTPSRSGTARRVDAAEAQAAVEAIARREPPADGRAAAGRRSRRRTRA